MLQIFTHWWDLIHCGDKNSQPLLQEPATTEEDQITPEHFPCLINFGMQSSILTSKDKCHGHKWDRNHGEKGLIHAGHDGINLTGWSTGSLHPRQHKLHFKKINCCKLHRDDAMTTFINKLFYEVMLKWRTKVQNVANTASKNVISDSLTASGKTSAEDRCQQCKMRIAKQFHDVTPSPTDQHELKEWPASSFGKTITSVLSNRHCKKI